MAKFLASYSIPWLTAVFPLITLTFLIAGLQHGQPAAATLPDGTFVVRVYYDHINQIDALSGYDVWEYNNLDEKYVLVAVDEAAYDTLIAAGWRVEIDQHTTTQINLTTEPATFFNGYRTVNELYTALSGLNSNYPTLSELVVYGESYCKQQGGCTTPGGDTHPGFNLKAIRITNEAVTGTSIISGTQIISGTKPVFFLMAGIHAREISTPELAVRMAEWLLQGYGTDPNATWLVDWHEVWIVPTANPDGHWLVELGMDINGSPLYHRKNGNRSNGCNTWPSLSYSQYGVDLNRNHSFAWGGAGTSTSPCSAVYRGPSAASEPETEQLQALVNNLIPDQRGPDLVDAAPANTKDIFITMHSYSELVLWPWGHMAADAPNRDGLQAIGDRLALFNGYTSCQPTSCLYAASGTSDDWAYGVLGVPAFTFEVGTQFFPPYQEIDAVQWPDNGPALQYAAKIARRPYQLALGPDVFTVTTAVSSTDMLTITAVLGAGHNGNQTINAAAFTLNTPYWVTGAVTQTLSPADGNFNNTIEAGTAVLDLNTLGNGRHTLFLRAQDAAGHWGPVTAVFIDNFPHKQYLPAVFQE